MRMLRATLFLIFCRGHAGIRGNGSILVWGISLKSLLNTPTISSGDAEIELLRKK